MPPKRRTYDVAFKKEVIRYIDDNHTRHDAWRHFSERDRFQYDESMFYQWYAKRHERLDISGNKKRARGAGRRPLLREIEDIISDKIVRMTLTSVFLLKYL